MKDPDKLTLRYGRFQAEASGRFAVAAVILAGAVLWLGGHVLGAW